MALVLVVEDEAKLARILEGYLRDAGHRTERASDGKQALELFRAGQPDLVLLDVMLPGLDGTEVLKAIRARSTVPVIMLTARVEEIDAVLALELGADDYVTKPFRPREVMARVKAVLRRADMLTISEPAPLRLGSLCLDSLKLAGTVDIHDLGLTPLEFCLLYELARHPGRVLSRHELLATVSPESDAMERTVDSHVTNLRRKLEAEGITDLIRSVRGVGYRLTEPT